MSANMLGGRYQVQDRIGTGGMATVYRGLDEVLGRTVAIKTMLPQYANDPSFAARFKQEAQAAAALQSPYIVSVYDWGKDADTYYIVMEYLRGTDLKSGIRKHGALDCKKVAQIGSQIAQALSVAHRHDIIHRDIKPQNIMVQPDGNIKVMDFGIARAKNSHLTQDNSVLGTAHYVSPEQTQGKELGPTTDIYSLGIVMYEAATGQVPFQGDDAISVALKQVNEQPKPPSQLNPNVDPQLESIILKCMQKNPADRFQTADELYRTLRDYLAGRMQAVNSATAMLPAQATSKLERGSAARATPASTAAMPRVERSGRIRTQTATEQAAAEEAERARKHRRNVVLGVIGGVAAVALIVFALVSLLGGGTQTAKVPYIIGLTPEEASDVITEAGFVPGEPEYIHSSSVDEGLVCEQDPMAQREMPLGSTVNFKVSDGAPPAAEVEVPDLRGKTQEEAEALLEQYGLLARRGDDEESDEYEEGEVSSQDQEPGTMVTEGSTITFHISSGEGQVVVPDVQSDSESSARTRIEDAGLVASVQYATSSTVDEGYVISVSPGVGTALDKGSTVTITVSSGPETVTVPSVIGWTYNEALKELSALGLNVSLASGSSADGIVTDQTVIGSVEAGASIVLTTQLPEPTTPEGGTGTGSGNATSDGSQTQGTTTGQSA
ncbi:MAG TPA: Stk1 family PASTA domain-containing Ser/Thr kinase [Candidatus Olsenella pullistercoris]|uniref:non-specific serine/threonine protein kinase n=1 Tax=Candidatus Olsenella pullistercoris TaxID=2838712 RepID=A0A9D2EY17_9ACTN|nr:Stk1 family PASTA domain-containing Ser/Thr kinase [Candidatus Olsenella pullistercoris]